MNDKNLLGIVLDTRKNNSIKFMRQLTAAINSYCRQSGYWQRFSYSKEDDRIYLKEAGE